MIVSRPAFSGLCQNVAIRYQIQCRSFSVSRFAAINRREQRQRSSKSLQKGMMRSGAAIDEMNEFGLLAENMVWPSRSSRPSFFTYPRLRLRLAGTRIWNFMFDIVGAVYFKFFLKKRPWPRLSLFSISRTAANLHTRMYTALAAGDTRTLQSLCCDSLLRSFSSRIASRPTNEKLRWRLHRYARRGGKPKLVAHKCAKFPSDGLGGATLALRQAVVRIRSVQSLERWREVKGRNGEVRVVREEEGEGEGREITEYLVLQQKFWKGEQGDWMVWGMVEEASVEDILGERVGRVEGKAAG
ncbi:hypothetical protein EV356DRAFT_537782 [Viridothelium virens]|uniref:Tim44-like domain-containing protein n=1 Tax=Viridothelium virens TaxID=1048519 RepID=A0A6A6GSN3_VIRVR|nr:hypothetical protein EV356DRAFT_537782 [Viridothelium virens]